MVGDEFGDALRRGGVAGASYRRGGDDLIEVDAAAAQHIGAASGLAGFINGHHAAIESHPTIPSVAEAGLYGSAGTEGRGAAPTRGRASLNAYGRSTICLPSGRSATGMSLKFAIPNGMPMIVMQSAMPETR